MANFGSEFFGFVFPGFQATQKFHAQSSRPELWAFLSKFTFRSFLNPKFIHGDFLLTGETKKKQGNPKKARKRRSGGVSRVSPEASGLGSPKVSRKSGDSPETLSKHFSETLRRLPRLRTTSTTTRDRNLQFRGAVSTEGSPLDFLLFLQYLCAI